MPPHLVLAPAKINLYLHIVGRRADGYHLLDSLVAFAGAADRLSFQEADELSLAVTGPFANNLAQEHDNLVLRAARALADLAGMRPTGRITLEKNLPVASGIGGGSADAAAAMTLLMQCWNIRPDPALIHQLALRLGADVPVCLGGRTVRMTGIGETLLPVSPMPPAGLLLVNPLVPLPTGPVFKARSGPFSAPAALSRLWPDVYTLAADLAQARNDLQSAATTLLPVIGSMVTDIAAQPDCLVARMSGSGATCFGLFPHVEAAQAAATKLGGRGWWVWAGQFGA